MGSKSKLKSRFMELVEISSPCTLSADGRVIQQIAANLFSDTYRGGDSDYHRNLIIDCMTELLTEKMIEVDTQENHGKYCNVTAIRTGPRYTRKRPGPVVFPVNERKLVVPKAQEVDAKISDRLMLLADWKGIHLNYGQLFLLVLHRAGGNISDPDGFVRGVILAQANIDSSDKNGAAYISQASKKLVSLGLVSRVAHSAKRTKSYSIVGTLTPADVAWLEAGVAKWHTLSETPDIPTEAPKNRVLFKASDVLSPYSGAMTTKRAWRIITLLTLHNAKNQQLRDESGRATHEIVTLARLPFATTPPALSSEVMSLEHEGIISRELAEGKCYAVTLSGELSDDALVVLRAESSQAREHILGGTPPVREALRSPTKNPNSVPVIFPVPAPRPVADVDAGGLSVWQQLERALKDLSEVQNRAEMLEQENRDLRRRLSEAQSETPDIYGFRASGERITAAAAAIINGLRSRG